MEAQGTPPIKVAIIGGGCAALTTAFELTRDEGRFDVTVYQRDFQLGGKGASGRNKTASNRTEEHGLHVWMGFYENAFRVMRDCYEELPAKGAACRFTDWREAFMPDPWVGVAEESRTGWRVWNSHFPANPGLPGDPLDEETNPFTLGAYLSRSVDLLRALVRSTFASKTPGGDAEDHDLEFSSVSPRAIVDKMASVIRAGIFTSAGALYEAVSLLKIGLSVKELAAGQFTILEFAEAIANNVSDQAEELIGLDEEISAKLELIELVVTVIVGILRDGLLSDPEGLDAINDEDCRDWLARHGASHRALNSSFVRALYNMAFVDPIVFGEERPEAVAAGPADKPGLAAGQALRGALRMFFTYRGSLFWKLRAGMGDVVFAPLYEVLKRRGVKFQFFHELEKVELSKPVPGQSRHVARLWFTRHARVRCTGGKGALAELAARDREYYPLDLDGCWPSTPDETQIERDGTKVALNVTEDFDFAVLAIGAGALERPCKELADDAPAWKAMLANVRTTKTRAMQLWLKAGVEELTNAPTPITVSGFEGMFDTWSDMTHIVAEENWEKGNPKGLVYFCSALSDHEIARDEKRRTEEALNEAVRYLDEKLPKVWPGARAKGGGFRWSQLMGVEDEYLTFEQKVEALRQHYLRLNFDASDEYVLARPTTLQYRISPLDRIYDNFTVAGDWTDCGFNEGCVEAAVMSGRLAAHALSGAPQLTDIVGYDHP